MNKLLVSKGELFYLVIIHVGNQVVNIENACNSVWTHFSNTHDPNRTIGYYLLRLINMFLFISGFLEILALVFDIILSRDTTYPKQMCY